MPWFLIEPSGYRYPITENEETGLSIGRTPDNDVMLNDLGVSRHHAAIRVREQKAWLYDRDSANGTWLNGERITGPRQLRDQDVIRVGTTNLRVLYIPPEPTPLMEPARTKPSSLPYFLIGIFLGLLGIALIAFATYSNAHRTTTAPTPAPYTRYAAVIPSTVFVLTPVGNSVNGRTGTGVILTEKGRILTAYNLVVNPTTGRSYNYNNLVKIGVMSAHKSSESLIWYEAHVVRADRQRGMAVLQIFAQGDGSPLPNSFKVPAVSLGSSDLLRPGDGLAVISFPAGEESGGFVQGTVLALGEGHVTGILPDPVIQADRGWLATDIALSQDNIGAPVLDKNGQLVGLYPGPDAAEKSGAPNNVRPITLARPLWITGP